MSRSANQAIVDDLADKYGFTDAMKDVLATLIEELDAGDYHFPKTFAKLESTPDFDNFIASNQSHETAPE